MFGRAYFEIGGIVQPWLGFGFRSLYLVVEASKRAQSKLPMTPSRVDGEALKIGISCERRAEKGALQDSMRFADILDGAAPNRHSPFRLW